MMRDEKIEGIAQVCHEANRAWCMVNGDMSQRPWAVSPQWQKDSMVAGVRFRLANPFAPPSASHENWMKQKYAEGWKFGPIKDEIDKTHPCMVPFEQLPEIQKRKDCLFAAIVASLTLNVGEMR